MSPAKNPDVAQRPIVLVGPMGAGKSAVGRRLAAILGLEFYDSDQEIERSTGVDIGYIFEKEGEAGFRLREHKMIAKLAGRPGVVLATGGGAVLDTATRNLLAERSTVVYLSTSVDQQLERTQRSRKRPLLENKDPRQALEDLFSVREPLYLEMADICIDTNMRKVFDVAREAAGRLRECAARAAGDETC